MRYPIVPPIVVLFLTIILVSGCSNNGTNLPLQKAEFAYELDTWMENSEVYEFTMKSNPDQACIMLMLDSGLDMAMDCFPKGPLGKGGKLTPDFSYELDTWQENSELYEFTPRMNTTYACMMFMLDNGKSMDLKCRPKANLQIKSSEG